MGNNWDSEKGRKWAIEIAEEEFNVSGTGH